MRRLTLKFQREIVAIILLIIVLLKSVVLAAENSSSLISVNNGWYIQTQSEPISQLTARLYGSYLLKSFEYPIINIASYRCEKSKSPFLRILLPKKIADIVRKKRSGPHYLFTSAIILRAKRWRTHRVGWFNQETDAVTIHFTNSGRQESMKKKELIEMMGGDFEIMIPLIGNHVIHYKYKNKNKSDRDMKLVADALGGEFILDKNINFARTCDNIGENIK